MVRLHTQRLLLRELQEEDAQDICTYMQDERMNFFIPDFPHPYTVENAKTYINNLTPQDMSSLKITWAIEYEGVVIGTINLHNYYPKRKNARIGYSLSFAHAGKGFATEAAKKLIEYAFSELPIEYIEARVFEENPASIRVLEKLGFVKEGLSKQHTYHRGRMLDCTHYGLRKNEFKN